MLVGREGERRELTRLLRDAAAGTSRSLVIRGDAGIGKTALLEFARARAKSFQVVEARGVESESELAFGALVGLVRPIASYLPHLPEQQRVALEAAIAVRSASIAHRLSAFAGFLGLVGIAAEDRPVLVLVDDLQWVDRSSAEAILFVARRLGADRVAIVMAARLHEDEGIDARFIPEMRLNGLGRDAGAELLRSLPRASLLAMDVEQRLIDLTGGAPLALREVPSLLSDAQLRGEVPLPEPLPAGEAIREAYRREVGKVSGRAIEALRVVAADDTGAIDVIQDALEISGLTWDALRGAEASGLLRVAGAHVEFEHPLLRSVIYHASPPRQRRRAHAALARAYARRDSVREAWHGSAATSGTNESIASALEAAAADATSRGGHDSAAMALERAAELTPDRSDQARRRYQAGMAAFVGGQPLRAGRNLDVALQLSADPVLRADVQRARGRLLYANGSLNDAFALLFDEALRVQDIAPARAVAMLNEACIASVGSADVEQGLLAATRARTIAKHADQESQFLAAMALAHPLILSANTKEAKRLLRKWKAYAADSVIPALSAPIHPIVGTAYTYEDFAFGHRLLDATHESARARAPDMLPQVLATLAHTEIQAGDWLLALAHSAEGSELGAVFGQRATQSFALATLATVEAGMGRPDSRAHADRSIQLAASTGARSMQAYASHALGLFELGRGAAADAIAPLEETAGLMRAWGTLDPLVIPWMPNLIEAYARAGRRSAAAELTTTLCGLADRTGMPWASAVAARCLGLIADDFDDHLRRSATLFAALPATFEAARTELTYAERLRRAGRRREARPHLKAATDAFRRLGAEPWAARAEAELGGTAEHVRARQHLGEQLSPQELQVSVLVGEGRTNREVAAALFVTPKTVEYHLGHVFEKLGVRSRTELARVMANRNVGAPRQPSMGTRRPAR